MSLWSTTVTPYRKGTDDWRDSNRPGRNEPAALGKLAKQGYGHGPADRAVTRGAPGSPLGLVPLARKFH